LQGVKSYGTAKNALEEAANADLYGLPGAEE
jgi:hypothetical protein